jgi:beta-glucosidase
MNLVRDPRWGRAQEVYSEDPYLSSQLTENFINGAQGPPNEHYLLTAACCKHYAAVCWCNRDLALRLPTTACYCYSY